MFFRVKSRAPTNTSRSPRADAKAPRFAKSSSPPSDGWICSRNPANSSPSFVPDSVSLPSRRPRCPQVRADQAGPPHPRRLGYRLLTPLDRIRHSVQPSATVLRSTLRVRRRGCCLSNRPPSPPQPWKRPSGRVLARELSNPRLRVPRFPPFIPCDGMAGRNH